MVGLQSEFPAKEVVFERVKGPLNGKCFIFQHAVMDLCGGQLIADVTTGGWFSCGPYKGTTPRVLGCISLRKQLKSGLLEVMKGCPFLLCPQELFGALEQER